MSLVGPCANPSPSAHGHQSSVSCVEFVRAFRPLRTGCPWLQGLRSTLPASFPLNHHTELLLHKELSSFPQTISAKIIFCLPDWFSSTFPRGYTPSFMTLSSHTSRKRFYILVFRGNQYDMWDLWTLLYKQLLPLLVQHPPFVLSKADQPSRLSHQELHPYYWISNSYLHSIFPSHYKGSTMQATLKAYTALQS